MKTPCDTCIYLQETKVGFRKFIGCSDDEMKKGFKYDNIMYWHSCKNHKPNDKCLQCKKYDEEYGYCDSNISKDNGVCINFESK